MGLNLLLSTNHIVIHSYSPVADFLLVVMCLLALLLIRQTFIKQSRTFRIFKSCFALLFIAAVSNIAFYYADLFSRQNTLLWILRAVYHISLLSLFCLYIAYLKILKSRIITESGMKISCPLLLWSDIFCIWR